MNLLVICGSTRRGSFNVDWLSRPHRASVLQGKPALVLSASPSRFGAVRAADHLRTVLARIGDRVLPVGLSVSTAHQRLGERVDPELVGLVTGVLRSVLDGRGSVGAQAEPELLTA